MAGYIAAKAMQVQRGGKQVDLKPGDPVPEAATWPNLDNWIAQKWIKLDDGVKAAKPAPAPEPVTEESEPDTLEDEETPSKSRKAKPKRR